MLYGIVDFKRYDIARDAKWGRSDFVALAGLTNNDAVPFCGRWRE